MKTSVLSVTQIVSSLVLTGSSFQLLGTGFRLPDQDAFATARGEAFVATADNPSAIYYNPAGITQLQGANFRAGIYAIDLEPSYRPLSPNDQRFDNEAKLHAAPQMYYTYGTEKSPFSFGVGLFSPYGLGLGWPRDTGFRTPYYLLQQYHLAIAWWRSHSCISHPASRGKSRIEFPVDCDFRCLLSPH